MRRSSSSSSLYPRMSRLPVRDSTSHAQNRKLSQEKHPLKKTSISSSNPNLLDVPYMNKRSGSLVRQNYCTPSVSGSSSNKRFRHKSPGWTASLKKDNRHINDKQWQLDQLSKVRHFVQKYFGRDYDTSSIKSGIAMDVFVNLMNCYFQLLYPEAVVKKENYMEEVPKLLKLFGYPGNVTLSLMKTVNTSHTWPHILGIFSWLSDLISDIDIPENYAPFSGIYNVVYEGTLDLLRQLHINKNSENVRQECIDKIDNEIVDYLKLDVNLLNDIDNQIGKLNNDIEKSNIKSTDLKSNIQVLESEIKELTEKCDKYEQQSKTFLNQLEQQKEKYSEKICKMVEEEQDLKDTEKRIQAVIDSQPYSLSQKELLNKELTNLQEMKKLGEERRQQQHLLIHKYDSNLTELMHTIQSKAYKYNNIVNNLELTNTEFKKLHIRESGFARNDTEEEMTNAVKLLKFAIDKIGKGSAAIEGKHEKFVIEEKKLQETIDDENRDIEELNKLDAELEHEVIFKNKQSDMKRRQLNEEIKKCENELSDLKKLRIELEPFEVQVIALQKQKKELDDKLQMNIQDSSYFFQELQKQMIENAMIHTDIMCEITKGFENIQETASKKADQLLESEHAVNI